MRWFDHIYVINLDSRPDRLEQVACEFKRLGYGFERFKAVDGDEVVLNWVDGNIPGWNKNAAALVETTIQVIKDAKEKGYESVLICEDDLFFAKDAKEFLDDYKMPEDGMWDMFHFGVMNEWRPKYFDAETIILKRAYCCHCYAVHSRVYDDYIELLKKRDRPIDWVTADFFQMHNRCFATRRAIAFQKPDYSNIRKKEVHNKVA